MSLQVVRGNQTETSVAAGPGCAHRWSVQCQAPAPQEGWLVGVRFPRALEKAGRSSRSVAEWGTAVPWPVFVPALCQTLPLFYEPGFDSSVGCMGPHDTEAVRTSSRILSDNHGCFLRHIIGLFHPCLLFFFFSTLGQLRCHAGTCNRRKVSPCEVSCLNN